MAALRWLVVGIGTIVVIFAVVHLFLVLRAGASHDIGLLAQREFDWLIALAVGIAGIMAGIFWMIGEYEHNRDER